MIEQDGYFAQIIKIVNKDFGIHNLQNIKKIIES